MAKFLLLRIVCLLCVSALMTADIFAQVGNTPLETESKIIGKTASISISHISPKPDELPYPGQKFKIRVQLKGTKETERQLRIIFIKDGSLIDMSSFNAELNEHDVPTYEISLHAPLAEMVYQFMLYNPDGSALSSPRYSVRRNCIPNVELAQGEVKPEIVGVERLQKLVNEAKHLEQDLAGYEQVLNLLDGLQKQLGGRKE